MPGRLPGSICLPLTLVPAYRLCPEHSLQASLVDAVAAYRWLSHELGSADRIVVGGASAGGGLALRLLCALRDAGDPLPAAAVVISPAADLALTAPSLRTNAASEAIFPPAVIVQIPKSLAGITDFRDPSIFQVPPPRRPGPAAPTTRSSTLLHGEACPAHLRRVFPLAGADLPAPVRG